MAPGAFESGWLRDMLTVKHARSPIARVPPVVRALGPTLSFACNPCDPETFSHTGSRLQPSRPRGPLQLRPSGEQTPARRPATRPIHPLFVHEWKTRASLEAARLVVVLSGPERPGNAAPGAPHAQGAWPVLVDEFVDHLYVCGLGVMRARAPSDGESVRMSRFSSDRSLSA